MIGSALNNGAVFELNGHIGLIRVRLLADEKYIRLSVQVLFRVCFLAGDGGQGQEYGADGGDVFFHHGELIVNGLKPKEQILKIKDERGWIINR